MDVIFCTDPNENIYWVFVEGTRMMSTSGFAYIKVWHHDCGGSLVLNVKSHTCVVNSAICCGFVGVCEQLVL